MPNNNNNANYNRPQNGNPNKGGHNSGNKQNGRDSNKGNRGSSQVHNINRYSLSGNLGLLFTRRYYHDLTKELVDDCDRLNIKQKEQQNLQNDYYQGRNDNIIAQAKHFVKPKDKYKLGNKSFELTTIYPGLLTGTGILHGTGHTGEAKLGLMFDHTTGLPYLPGSSVKGLLRSLFPLRDIETADKWKKEGLAQKEKALSKNDNVLKKKAEELINNANALLKQADEKRNYIVSIMGKDGFTKEMVDDLERSIFDGVEIDEEGKSTCISINDIFFDAFPEKAGKYGLLSLDYITPHNNGEFKDPTPLQFIRISPEVTFQFQFQLHNSKKNGKEICSIKEKEDLFKEILTTVGIGAKTNVGYGQLVEN